jgi:hypothetical protein
MRILIAALLLSLAASAQAQLLAPRGAKATLQVEYLYTAAGTSGSANGGAIDEWNVRRVVSITAQYVAEEPMAIAALHRPDATQQAAMNTQQAQVQGFARKMEPTMADMMKIMERCGEDEACISKAISDYGNQMDLKEVQARKAEGQAIQKPGAPRYQLWKQVSQSGTYEVDETTTRQVFEMTCTRTQVCKRVVTTRGKGAVPPPPGGSVEGASLLEVDSVKKDMEAKMPVPLQGLKVESKAQSNIPDDDYQAEQTLPVRILKGAESLTLAIPGDALQAAGTKTIKGTGAGAESGTLTVKWTFKRN